MSDLKPRFEAAVADSQNLSQRPDNATLLNLYGLYKQATAGDSPAPAPASAIWWAAPSGMPGMP